MARGNIGLCFANFVLGVALAVSFSLPVQDVELDRVGLDRLIVEMEDWQAFEPAKEEELAKFLDGVFGPPQASEYVEPPAKVDLLDEILKPAPESTVLQPPMSTVFFIGIGIFDEKGGAVAIQFVTEDGRIYEIPFVDPKSPEVPKKTGSNSKAKKRK